TGIAVQLPEGYEAQVRPRSGVTAKTKLRVQLGTIDNGYTGEIGVIVDNTARKEPNVRQSGFMTIGDFWEFTEEGSTNAIIFTYKIRKGDRIAQLVIQRLSDVEAIEVFDVGESERGSGGFGSTGVSSE